MMPMVPMSPMIPKPIVNPERSVIWSIVTNTNAMIEHTDPAIFKHSINEIFWLFIRINLFTPLNVNNTTSNSFHIECKRSFRTRRTHKNEKFYYFLRTDMQNQTHVDTVAGLHDAHVSPHDGSSEPVFEIASAVKATEATLLTHYFFTFDFLPVFCDCLCSFR